MSERIPIFISATSKDLSTARDTVAKLLISLGYDPVWQDMAATEGGNLLELLKKRIDPCKAVIQLVGLRYGMEPSEIDSEYGRTSYTQFEAIYAEQTGKQVIYVFLDEQFPYDPCDPEEEEFWNLQQQYRFQLQQSDKLHHQAASLLELENRVLRFRDDLQELRNEIKKSRRRVIVAGSALAFLVLAGVFAIVKFADPDVEGLDRIEDRAVTIDDTTRKIESKTTDIEKQVKDSDQFTAFDRLADSLGVNYKKLSEKDFEVVYSRGDVGQHEFSFNTDPKIMSLLRNCASSINYDGKGWTSGWHIGKPGQVLYGVYPLGETPPEKTKISIKFTPPFDKTGRLIEIGPFYFNIAIQSKEGTNRAKVAAQVMMFTNLSYSPVDISGGHLFVNTFGGSPELFEKIRYGEDKDDLKYILDFKQLSRKAGTGIFIPVKSNTSYFYQIELKGGHVREISLANPDERELRTNSYTEQIVESEPRSAEVYLVVGVNTSDSNKYSIRPSVPLWAENMYISVDDSSFYELEKSQNDTLVNSLFSYTSNRFPEKAVLRIDGMQQRKEYSFNFPRASDLEFVEAKQRFYKNIKNRMCGIVIHASKYVVTDVDDGDENFIQIMEELRGDETALNNLEKLSDEYDEMKIQYESMNDNTDRGEVEKLRKQISATSIELASAKRRILVREELNSEQKRGELERRLNIKWPYDIIKKNKSVDGTYILLSNPNNNMEDWMIVESVWLRQHAKESWKKYPLKNMPDTYSGNDLSSLINLFHLYMDQEISALEVKYALKDGTVTEIYPVAIDYIDGKYAY